MNCKNCGLPLDKGERNCQHCGQPARKGFKLFLISILSVLFISGIILGVFLFQDQSIDSPSTKPDKTPIEQINPVDDSDKKESNKNKKPQANTKDSEGKETGKKSSEEESKKTKKSDSSKESQDAEKSKDSQDSKKSEKSQESQKTTETEDRYIVGEETAAETQPKLEKQEMELEQKEDLTDYIDTAKKTVYTVSTPEMQGSGFLFDWNGVIITNAHVVEGWTEATVRSNDGKEYTGKLIGYSNKTDVAVLHVPELKGQKPFPYDPASTVPVGEEIVALGSPNGVGNSATMGFITGKDRNFIIGSFVYNNLYQISAPIAPGSSGGPLISKNSQKIIAINSAQSTTDYSIGFSIPISQVTGIIQGWVDRPMTDNQLLEQFYEESGDPIIGTGWGEDEGYFEEGDFSEDEKHYNYSVEEYEEAVDEDDLENSEDEETPKVTPDDTLDEDEEEIQEAPPVEETEIEQEEQEEPEEATNLESFHNVIHSSPYLRDELYNAA